MVEPPMEDMRHATLAVEYEPVYRYLKPVFDRVAMLDQVYPIDLNRSGLTDPTVRVWESFLDFLMVTFKVMDGADPEEEYEFYNEWSFGEFVFSYSLEHLDIYEANNRRSVAAQEITTIFNALLHNHLLDKIVPIKQMIEQQGLKIRHITGSFFPEINRILFELTLGHDYDPNTLNPSTHGPCGKFDRRNHPVCVL